MMQIGDSFAWKLDRLKDDGRQIQTLGIMVEDLVNTVQKYSTVNDNAEWGNIRTLLEIIIEKAESLHEDGAIFSEMWEAQNHGRQIRRAASEAA